MSKPNHERPIEGAIYADEYIDFWGRVYLANPHLRARGVLFATFLIAPEVLLHACSRPPVAFATSKEIAAHVARRHSGIEDFPAAWPQVTARFELAEGHGENGRMVEKLRHRFFPRRRAKRVLVDAN